MPRADLAQRGVDVHETGRGGDVTYHGPGQLVAYPIFDLQPDRLDVRRYVRDLARVMIGLAADHGVERELHRGRREARGRVGGRRRAPGAGRAIRASRAERRGRRRSAPSACACRAGSRCTGSRSTCRPDLEGFRLIVPCGIAAYGVTSLASLGVPAPAVEDVARASVAHFARVFEARTARGDASSAKQSADAGRLQSDAAGPPRLSGGGSGGRS